MRSIFPIALAATAILTSNGAIATVMMIGTKTDLSYPQGNAFASAHYVDATPSPHPSLYIWDDEFTPIEGGKGGVRPKTEAELLGENISPEDVLEYQIAYLTTSVNVVGGLVIMLDDETWLAIFENSTKFDFYANFHTPVLVEDATYFTNGFFEKGNQWFYTQPTWYTPWDTNTPSFTWVYWFGQGWLGCFGNGWVWDATANTFSWTTPESFPIGYQP